MSFTKKRFLDLPAAQQHKKKTELLRRIYDNRRNEIGKELLEEYNELQAWADEKPLESLDAEKIADSFHCHLRLSGCALSEHNLLPTIKTKDREQAAPLWPISIYLDNIRSAFNVGSILRTVEAFSLGHVYCSESTPGITHNQVKKAAMGTDQWMTVYSGVSLKTLPKPVIALELSENAVSLYDFIFPESFSLVLGNEEYGCSAESVALADYMIEIPMRGRKNSLNVANAFAIVAGEIQRQKQLLM